MPITQSRMIALINAANDYKSALETILDSIRTLADDISQSKTTPSRRLPIPRSNGIHPKPVVPPVCLSINNRS